MVEGGKTKLWIPGGTGMLGHALVDEARRRGLDVIATGRNVDAADPAAVAALWQRERPDAVVICAAHTHVDNCEKERELAHRLNAVLPGVVARAAAEHHAFSVLVSTDYVFSGTAGTPPRPYREDDAKGPLSTYGRTKLMGEGSFLDGGGSAIVRTSWLWGLHGRNFVDTMRKLMSERDELRVVADQHGRPTYTRDLARALVDVVERRASAATRGVLHFANTGATSWHGFACAIRDELATRSLPLRAHTIHAIATSEYPTPAVRPAWSVLDTSKIEALLGWSPPPWRDALSRYFDELR